MLHNNPGILAIQSRITILHDTQNQAVERKNTLISRIDTQKQRINQLEIKVKKKQLERDDIQREIDELNQKKTEKEQEYQANILQKNATQQKLSQEENQLSTIKNEITAKKQERQRVKKRVEELNEITKRPVIPIWVYSHSRDCTVDQYHFCCMHPNDPRTALNAAACQAFQSALTERSSLIQLQNQINGQLGALESISYSKEKEVEYEREKLQREESALNFSQEKIKQIENKIQAAQQKLESASNEVSAFERDVADVKNFLEESLAEKGGVESKIDVMQNTLDHLEQELKQLEMELNKKNSQEREEKAENEARKELIEEQARQELIEETARNELIEEQARQELLNEGVSLGDIATTVTDLWPNAVSGLLTNSIFNRPQMKELERELGGNPKEGTGNLLLDNFRK